MKKEMLAIRCPRDLLQRIDRLAISDHCTRSSIMLEAVRLFSQELRRRGGDVVPPVSGKKLLSRLAKLSREDNSETHPH